MRFRSRIPFLFCSVLMVVLNQADAMRLHGAAWMTDGSNRLCAVPDQLESSVFRFFRKGATRILEIRGRDEGLRQRFCWLPDGSLIMEQVEPDVIPQKIRRYRWLSSGEMLVDPADTVGKTKGDRSLGEYTCYAVSGGKMDRKLDLFGQDGNTAIRLNLLYWGRLEMWYFFPGAERVPRRELEWDSSGELIREVNHDASGRLDGRQFHHSQDGTWHESHYAAGKLEGICTDWDKDRHRVREQTYAQGKPKGPWREWTSDGHLIFVKQMDDERVLSVEWDSRNLPVYPISTVAELRKSIGSFRRLVLQPGAYDLSRPGKVPLKLNQVANLVIEVANGGKPAHLFVSDPHSEVLWLAGCTGVTLSGLKMGHEVPAEAGCTSGVLIVSGGSGICVHRCHLYGSGTTGLYLNGVSDFVFEDSIISDCTINLMEVSNSQRIRFDASSFLRTGAYDCSLVWMWRSEEVLFQACRFAENWTSGSLFAFSEMPAVRLEKVVFEHNLVPALARTDMPKECLSTCTFRDNGFPVPGAPLDRATDNLYAALENGSVEGLRSALQQGASVNFSVRPRPTPLVTALQQCARTEILSELLAAGADPNQLSFFSSYVFEGESYAESIGIRPLAAWAATLADGSVPQERASGLMDLLIRHGADINGRNTDGGTPLMVAARGTTRFTTELLLQAGAEINVRNKSGQTALSLAVSSLLPEQVRLLLAQRADPQLLYGKGNTLLHLAVDAGAQFGVLEEPQLSAQLGVVRDLMAAGVDPAIRNEAGQTAAGRARERGLTHVLALLESKPATSE